MKLFKNNCIAYQKEIQRKAIERHRNITEPRFAAWASPEENRAARDYFVKEIEKDLAAISQPIQMPLFSTLIKDSDDNLLFFVSYVVNFPFAT